MAASMKTFGRALTDISSISDNPEDFLRVQKSYVATCKKTLKSIYDATKKTDEAVSFSSGLPELVVKNFDDEQIWQQVELQNDSMISNLVSGVAKLISKKSKCFFQTDKSIDANKSDVKVNVSSSQKRAVSIGTSKRKSQKTDKVQKGQKVSDVASDLDDDLSDGSSNETGASDDEQDEGVLGSDDDELDNIKENLNQEKDKFFDFTGDSDEDLQYDTGAFGKTKDLSDALFKEEEDIDEDDSENKIGKKKQRPEKSVKFNSVDAEDGTGDKLQDRLVALSQNRKVPKRTSVVDDAFFKLADLEEFLDEEDKKEERRQKRDSQKQDDESDDDDDDDIDLFADVESDDQDIHYEDFFDPPDGVTIKDGGDDGGSTDDDVEEEDREEEQEEEESEEEEEGEAGSSQARKTADLFADSDSEGEDVADILGGRKDQKSAFEVRQEKLKKKISALEEASLAERPWQMLGETSGGSRPENSLLQENLQFEHTSRLPPEITEETTKSLEDIIRQRIKDKVWDDVVRKVRKVENPFEYKKRITLDQEKSKLSLGEIYEQEYLKQQQTEAEEKKDPDHEEIKKMMTSLFLKLDALSNFHYTPKQAAPEVKIISNQPAITMEEVAPVSISETKQLAPEEVLTKVHGELKGATEKTDADKLRERKKKKADKKERQREKEKRQKLIEKLNPGLGNKYSKEKAMKKLEKESKTGKGQVTLIKSDKKEKTGLRSSQAFFTQLQEEVTTQISSKKTAKRKDVDSNIVKAKKLKL